MADFCLLIFSRNSNSDVLRLVDKLDSVVEEIVVIDSSDDLPYYELSKRLPMKVKVHRVFPTGTNDLFRQYVTNKINSDYVLIIDCDEDITEEFKSSFRRFDKESAYLVGWRHVYLNETAKKIIIYRNKYVKWMGHLFETPEVTGRTLDISNELTVLHYADFERGYLKEQNKRERYFFLESILRPFSWATFFKQLHPLFEQTNFIGRLRKHPPTLLWKFALTCVWITRSIETPSLRNTATFLLSYGKERLSYWNSLTRCQKSLYSLISQEIYRNGGLIRYLNLDDPEYVDRLATTYNWSEEKPSNTLKKLLMYRFLHGQSLPSFYGFPYSSAELNAFWSKGDFE